MTHQYMELKLKELEKRIEALEQEPILDKLKHQIHEKTFESGMMNPIMTYAEIMHMIDNLLSERGEEE